MANNTQLKRSLSLPLVTFFGLGNILGAGIYALIGKVAGEAGLYTPLAFCIASVVAAISAFSYAELSSRYPVSAGVAVFLQQGLNIRVLSIAVGLMIALAGMVSAAALAHGFAGYLSVFIDMPQWLMIVLIIMLLGALAIWGISESVMVAAICTLIEILGLLFVIIVGADFLSAAEHGVSFPDRPSLAAIPWAGVLSGAFLAFYAYLGFEDMVNVAEEARQPEKNMPRAILLAVGLAAILYAGVAFIAVLTVAPQQLALSDAPLADVYTTATGREPVVISLISIFAVINGALIQIIMASRLLYGMACKGWLPPYLANIHAGTYTPARATVLVTAIILLFSLALHLEALARLTSYLVLTVFALVNLSLIKIKRREPTVDKVRVFPIWVPQLGFVTTVVFLLFESISRLHQ